MKHVLEVPGIHRAAEEDSKTCLCIGDIVVFLSLAMESLEMGPYEMGVLSKSS